MSSLLMLFVCVTCPGTAPMLAGAAVTLMDADHSVALVETADGMRLILGHDRSPDCPRAVHRHHGIVRLLTGVPGGAHPDHEVRFAQSPCLGDAGFNPKPAFPMPDETSDGFFGLFHDAEAGTRAFEALLRHHRVRPMSRCWIPSPRASGWETVCLLL